MTQPNIIEQVKGALEKLARQQCGCAPAHGDTGCYLDCGPAVARNILAALERYAPDCLRCRMDAALGEPK